MADRTVSRLPAPGGTVPMSNSLNLAANFTTLRNTILTKQLNESNGQPINGIVATVTDTTSAAALTLSRCPDVVSAGITA